jgi:uncharacterized protein
MNFWDASAIVPLAFAEDRSAGLRRFANEEPEMLVWWATGVECVSAVARRERAGAITAEQAQFALETIDQLAAVWQEVAPSESVRVMARRMLRVHDLRAADAFQLAAAYLASEERPDTLEFVTLDERLTLAAGREGFRVLPG